MSLILSLEKREQALRLNLAKRGMTVPPQADVGFVLDVSGSYEGEHKDGSTQELLERLVPWGMTFDPDQKLDVFSFSDGSEHAYHVGEITPETTENYIRREIIHHVPGWNGGTDYSYVLEEAMRNFGWLASEEERKPRGFFGKLFGKKEEPVAAAQRRRSLILFNTDGENSDQRRTWEVLQAAQERGDEIYFLFVAISRDGHRFPFLQKIADAFDNTGLVVIEDLRRFVRMSDDEVNDLFITDELLAWLKK